jgi:folate-dependent phosphoribosylglycinamide formyltransferase PurN
VVLGNQIRLWGQRLRTVLICHDGDAFDQQGLARWMASFSNLAGMVIIQERSGQVGRRVKREVVRSGLLRFMDILAYRLYSKVFLSSQYRTWLSNTMIEFVERYGDLPTFASIYTHSPNSAEVEAFLKELQPDIMVARCKFILKDRIFEVPKVGTFVIHPGICPEYRNAHGCFWALAKRDMAKVGVTLLKVDKGVDTGPIYGYFTYPFDEKNESHLVIQQRCVYENLDAIAEKLKNISQGRAEPIPVTGRESNVWGQPWMTKYVEWKLAARRA